MSQIEKTEEQWKSELTPEQFRILREKGTERAWTGELLNNKETGMYECAGCGTPLFESDTKYESGCGWPSFFAPVSKEAVGYHLDKSHGMIRTEITCKNCGGHLGHVFHDGPQPTGDRYCVNSVSLKFNKAD